MAAMVSEIDIYRSAKLLIDQHGEDASVEAAMRADAMLEKGAMAGAATWRRIVKVMRIATGEAEEDIGDYRKNKAPLPLVGRAEPPGPRS